MRQSDTRHKSNGFLGRQRRARRRRQLSRSRHAARLRRFEPLENRLLLAVFTPSKDNTLYEDPAGGASNGAGPSLYAGLTDRPSNPLRRALLAFDLTSIPVGSTVTAASLSLLVTRNPMESLDMHEFAVHRVTSDWGEGTSVPFGAGGLGAAATAGDATWIHTTFDTATWTTPGGDFVPTASATTSVGNDGAFAVWSSEGLINDVQAWVNSPTDNFGWIIRGQETTPKQARRFASREGVLQPMLDITFTPPAEPATVTLAIDNVEIAEAAGTAVVTATLSEAQTQPVTVDLGFSGTATTPDDYTASATQIVIAAGATSGTTTLTAVSDTVEEPDESITVDILGVTNAQESGTQQVTTVIVDDDTVVPEVTLSVDNLSISEAGGVATLTANLSVPTTVPVTVNLSFDGTAGAEDFTASATQIVVSAGSTSGSLTITAAQDALDEPNEFIGITVDSVENGTAFSPVGPTITINDDDDEPTVTLSVDRDAISEAEEVATITATLSAPSGRDVTVGLDVGGTATAGVDYSLAAAPTTAIRLSNSDFTTTPAFSDVQTFDFDIELGVPLAAGSYANPTMNRLDYSVSGTLVAGTPSGFSGFALSRSFTDAAFYLQGSSLSFEVAPTADLSDGVQVSELTGADPVFVFNGREDGTGRFHPALLELNSDGTGRIQNSNNAPAGTPIAFGAEYITDLTFDPATLTIARAESQVVIPAGSTTATVAVTAIQDTVEEPDETVEAAIASVRNGEEVGDQEVTVTILDDDDATSFVVTSLDATDSGVRIAFNAPLDLADLNLYDTVNAGQGAADVVVTGSSVGPVAGSLILGETSVEFIASGDRLEPDTYTITLRSATNGFEDTGGRLLDGNGDGTAGDDYVSQFVVTPAEGARTVGLPDFVRGPGQDVNLPANETNGIPITISEGSDVRSIDLRISYDPALLTITGATAAAGGAVVVDTTTAGLAILNYTNETALPAGEVNFVNLVATVPATDASAIYGRNQVVDVHDVVARNGTATVLPTISDDALHFVTFFADVSGNGRINAADAAQVARFAALLDRGFVASLVTDPFVLGDISGNGRLNAADASRVARFAALLPVDEIPPLPGGVIITGVNLPTDDNQSDSTADLEPTALPELAQMQPVPEPRNLPTSESSIWDEVASATDSEGDLALSEELAELLATDRP